MCRAPASTAAWGSLIRYRTERAPACAAHPERGRALAGAHCLPDPGFTQLASLFFRVGYSIYVIYSNELRFVRSGQYGDVSEQHKILSCEGTEALAQGAAQALMCVALVS